MLTLRMPRLNVLMKNRQQLKNADGDVSHNAVCHLRQRVCYFNRN